jgi:hypothetical protein
MTVRMGEDTCGIYINGVDVTGYHNAERWLRRTQPSSSDPFYIGRVQTYSNAMGPMPLMTFRVDNEVWDADRIAQEHATLANPGSLEAIVPARGRTYKIRSIPSTPSTNAGDATWSGTIELEQSGYTAALADITAKE